MILHCSSTQGIVASSNISSVRNQCTTPYVNGANLVNHLSHGKRKSENSFYWGAVICEVKCFRFNVCMQENIVWNNDLESRLSLSAGILHNYWQKHFFLSHVTEPNAPPMTLYINLRPTQENGFSVIGCKLCESELSYQYGLLWYISNDMKWYYTAASGVGDPWKEDYVSWIPLQTAEMYNCGIIYEILNVEHCCSPVLHSLSTHVQWWYCWIVYCAHRYNFHCSIECR